MLLNFIATVALLYFVFRLLLIIWDGVFHYVFGFLPNLLGLVISQVVLCLFYGGLFALVSVEHSSQSGITASWVYAFFGFFASYVAVGSHSGILADMVHEGSPSLTTKEKRILAFGGGMSILGSLVVFLICYKWPGAIASISAVANFIKWVSGWGEWIAVSWIGLFILAFIVFGYIVEEGLSFVTGGVKTIRVSWLQISKCFQAKNATLQK